MSKRVTLTLPMLVVIQRSLVDMVDLPLETGDESKRARLWVRQELARRRAAARESEEERAYLAGDPRPPVRRRRNR